MNQVKSNIRLFDKSYQESKSASYKLYVELSYSMLKLAVLDSSSNTFIGFETHAFDGNTNDFNLSTQLSSLLNTLPLFRQEYASMIVAIANNRVTLIPNAVYKTDKLEEFHHFNFSIQEDDEFYSDRLINTSAHTVYSIPNPITKLFTSYKNCSFRHIASALIDAALMDSKFNKAISSIYVNVLPESFQLIVIKDQKLELYNAFNYHSNEDFIYYLLFTLDQLHINNEEAGINLSGAIEKHDELYQILHQYIKTLQFVEPSGQINRSYMLEEVPRHFHFELFHLYLCE
ncbi:MAG: DUF3822 family protein [Flavobacteriales bacterium]|nr:DUF3822 family protein [Flavobacteriales bacterium]